MAMVPALNIENIELAVIPVTRMPSPSVVSERELLDQFITHFKYIPRSDGCDYALDVTLLPKDKEERGKRIVNSAFNSQEEQEKAARANGRDWWWDLFCCCM